MFRPARDGLQFSSFFQFVDNFLCKATVLKRFRDLLRFIIYSGSREAEPFETGRRRGRDLPGRFLEIIL